LNRGEEKQGTSKKQEEIELGLLFDTEDGGDMFLRFVGLSLNDTALQPEGPASKSIVYKTNKAFI
jgi:hypothetical protein